MLMLVLVVLTTFSHGQNKSIKFDDLIKGEISGVSYLNNLEEFINKEYIDGVYLRDGMNFDIDKILDTVNGRFNIDTIKLVSRKIKYDLTDNVVSYFNAEINGYMESNNLIFESTDTVFILHITISSCIGEIIGPIHVKSKNVNITGESGSDNDLIPIRKGVYGEPIYIVDDKILNILHSWNEERMKEIALKYIPTTFNSEYYSLYRFIIKDGKIIDRSVRIIPY